jgi:RNA polymerase sigma-70 factor (ECF subfamily)
VLQEVWLLAFQGLGRFRGEARVGTWLARIAAREGLRARDRGQARRWRTTALEPGMRGEPEVRGPGPQALASMRDELDVLLARLPETGRAAFVLAACGWSYAEVAELLGRPSGTVATWIHRARRELAARPA